MKFMDEEKKNVHVILNLEQADEFIIPFACWGNQHEAIFLRDGRREQKRDEKVDPGVVWTF